MKNLNFRSTVSLRDGRQLPVIGYSSVEHEYNHKTQREIFQDAIELGYRFFDLSYDDDCLRPLRDAIDCSKIPRNEFFISCRNDSRQNRLDFGISNASEMFEEFGGYIDLVSICWPFGENMCERWAGPIHSNTTANGYPGGFQSLYPEKACCGVCNFDIHHLEELKAYPAFKLMPFVDQNQFHPLYLSEELREYCKKNGIVFVRSFETDDAFAPKKPVYQTDVMRTGEYFAVSERERLANINTLPTYTHALYHALIEKGVPEAEMMKTACEMRIRRESPFDVSKDPRRETDFYASSSALKRMADKYGKTNRQIVDRWTLQHGVVILIKGIWKEDMERGKDIFDFALTEEEMKYIDSFNMDKRLGFHPDYIDF